MNIITEEYKCRRT